MHEEDTMNWRKLILAAIFAGLGSSAAHAQRTLGDLLDAGAVKLSRQEVLTTLSGANMSGPGRGGGTTQVDYHADGTYAGSYQGAAGDRALDKGGGFFGKWTVDDSGRMCTEGSGGSGKATANCYFFFRVGDQLYLAIESDNDRSAVVLKRTARH
jgi:hypothetical protein